MEVGVGWWLWKWKEVDELKGHVRGGADRTW